MYISSYIKDPIPFLVVGGKSGIGKTRLIDALFEKYPDEFEQPLSFTTRQPRNKEDRYEFVTEGELRAMNERGELLNFDDVYGNFYGIARDAVRKIQASGRIPVKEIHPKNFFKFDVAGLNTIKILVENRHLDMESSPFVPRPGRSEEFDFESFNDYDICLNLAGNEPDKAAEYLVNRIIAFRLHMRSYPHPRKIEETNRKGYDAIAAEFNDELRITTKNFHDASRPFWDQVFRSLPNPINNQFLELGAGNGWLFNTTSVTNLEIDALDLSASMSIPYARNIFRCSARNIPVGTDYYDFIVGSLIDPFLVPELFLESARVLKKGGRMIFTTPSWEWALRLPNREMHKTTFKKANGDGVEVFSFCDPLLSFFQVNGLTKLSLADVVNLTLDKNYPDPISPAIIQSASAAGKLSETMPIVTGVVLEKGA